MKRPRHIKLGRKTSGHALLTLLSALMGCVRSPEPPASVRDVQLLPPRSGSEALTPGARLVGSAKCAECHTEEAREQRAHHMFLTGRAIGPRSPSEWPGDAELQKPVNWAAGSRTTAPAWQAGKGQLVLEGKDSGGKTVQARPLAVFGSGLHGMTPISGEADKRIRELKLSFSPSSAAWVATPGSKEDPDPVGTPSTSERSVWCLSCHSTAIAWQSGILDAEHSIFGIHCERCHGPGSAHTESMEKGSGGLAIVGPATLRADESVKLCAECHRLPSDLDPGDALKRDASIARHAGATLMLSACFRRSPPEHTITCTECHSPHRNIDKERDDYRRPCLRCHANPERLHPRTSLEANANCAGCHMPVEKQSLASFSFTDHWIRVPGSPPPLQSPQKAEIMSFLEASYRDALRTGGRGPEHRATLETRLGDLLCAGGRLEDGVAQFRAALALLPPYSDRVRLAERLERAGKSEEAIQALEAAVSAEPSFNRARHALVKLQLKRKAFDRAAEALSAWERSVPGDPLRAELARELEQTRASTPSR